MSKTGAEMRECPHCREAVKASANRCPHCGGSISDAAAAFAVAFAGGLAALLGLVWPVSFAVAAVMFIAAGFLVFRGNGS